MNPTHWRRGSESPSTPAPRSDGADATSSVQPLPRVSSGSKDVPRTSAARTPVSAPPPKVIVDHHFSIDRTRKWSRCHHCTREAIETRPWHLRLHLARCKRAPRSIVDAINARVKHSARLRRGTFSHRCYDYMDVIGLMSAKCVRCGETVRGHTANVARHANTCASPIPEGFVPNPVRVRGDPGDVQDPSGRGSSHSTSDMDSASIHDGAGAGGAEAGGAEAGAEAGGAEADAASSVPPLEVPVKVSPQDHYLRNGDYGLCHYCGKSVRSWQTNQLRRHMFYCKLLPKAVRSALDARAKYEARLRIRPYHSAVYGHFEVRAFMRSRCLHCSRVINGDSNRLREHLRACTNEYVEPGRISAPKPANSVAASTAAIDATVFDIKTHFIAQGSSGQCKHCASHVQRLHPSYLKRHLERCPGLPPSEGELLRAWVSRSQKRVSRAAPSHRRCTYIVVTRVCLRGQPRKGARAAARAEHKRQRLLASDMSEPDSDSKLEVESFSYVHYDGPDDGLDTGHHRDAGTPEPAGSSAADAEWRRSPVVF